MMSIVARSKIKKNNDKQKNYLLESTSEFLEELKEFHDAIQLIVEKEINKNYVVKENQEEQAHDNKQRNS